ncbi:hypothetical protein D3C77_241800 [compost metagenome]
MWEVNAEVVPGLVRHFVALEVQRLWVAIGDFHYCAALAQRLVAALLVVEQHVFVAFGLFQVLHRLVELVQVHLEPIEPVLEREVELMALAPFIHQRTFFCRGFSQQQAAVIADFADIALDLVQALGGIVDECPALMQVIPIYLAPSFRNLGGFALVAELTRHGRMLAGETMGAGFVVQTPYQRWEFLPFACALLGQRLQGLERERPRAHRRDGIQAVVQQRDGVKDALDDPKLLNFLQVNRSWAPPIAFGRLTRSESRLLLAEPVRLVDQPLPEPAFLQGEPHGGAADVQLTVPVVVLGVPAFDQVEVEAAGKLDVGVGRCPGILLRGRVALAVVVEQIPEQFLNVPLFATFALAAALDEPRFILSGIQLFLATARAGALAQILRSGPGLQAVLVL